MVLFCSTIIKRKNCDVKQLALLNLKYYGHYNIIYLFFVLFTFTNFFKQY